MNIQLRHLGALALGLLLGLSACRSEAPDAPTTPTNSPAITSGQVVTLPVSITAVADEPTAQQARAMSFDIQGTSYGSHTGVIPKIKHEALKSFTSVIVLANKTDNKKYVGSATWTQKVENGKTTYVLDKMTAPDAVNLKTGEWYLMAATGGAEQKNAGNNLPTRIEVKADTDLRPVSQGNVHSMVVPFLTAWRKLTWDAKDGNAELADKSTLLTFKTPGVFVVLDVQNYMKFTARVQREITLESNGFATQGYYDIDNISTSAISDKQENNLDYWKTTNPTTAASTGSDPANVNYRNTNAPHYISKFKLLKGGQNTGGSSDAYYELNAPTGNAPTSLGKYYILWLQPLWTQNRSNFNAKSYELERVIYASKNVFYASAEAIDPTGQRTHYTKDESTYTGNYDPSTWRPYLGSRYIYGTMSGYSAIGNADAAGKSFYIQLRTIRPFLPVEHVWPIMNAGTWEDLPRNLSEEVLNNQHNSIGAEFALHGGNNRWRFPDVRELIPVIRMPYESLYIGAGKEIDTFGSAGLDARAREWPAYPQTNLFDGKEISGLAAPVYIYWPRRHGTYPPSNASSQARTIYALLYRNVRGNKGTGAWQSSTGNYYVAMRMTWEDPLGKSSTGRRIYVECYYLGPNFNNGGNAMDRADYAYVCDPLFWEQNIDKNAIVSRSIPYSQSGMYYWTQRYGTTSNANGSNFQYTPNGTNENAVHITSDGDWRRGGNQSSAALVPWLRNPAW